MKNELNTLFNEGRSKKRDPTNIDIRFMNLFNRLIAQLKMIGRICEKGQFIYYEKDIFGNRTEFDDDFLRLLTISQWNHFLILNMEVVLLKPDQQMLSFSKKIDIIQHFLMSSVNSESKGLSFYSHLDQIYAKYTIYLPDAITVEKMGSDERNSMIYNIEERHRMMEQQIMSYKDQLLSALDLDDQEIKDCFPQHLQLYHNYIEDSVQIDFDSNQQYESVIARECEIYLDQIQIDGGEQKNINTQSETDQEIANNGNNKGQLLQKLNYEVKVYSVETRVGLHNQGHFRNYQEILGGELFQEFQRKPISKQLQIQLDFEEFVYPKQFQTPLEFEDSIYIPLADPRQKNVLQEELPDVDISILRKFLILREAMVTINENQKQLANPKFKGKFSVLIKIRFCNALGSRPIFIMRKIKKEKKSIDQNAILVDNYKIIKNLMNVLFFKDRYDDEIKPIHNLCQEFLHSFCDREPQNSEDDDQESQDSHYVPENLPDIEKYLRKLETLILLIKTIYRVPF
ncbi:unnamed protein product [Paramecium octaurelia]|uniref:Uncharacterized protein n=1 Tax=Paramecium octaurelia TaxID=43137 RepID=A0A8S1WHM2_PAROT|nr:unnamed protein product [Paramecium octaurelia]